MADPSPDLGPDTFRRGVPHEYFASLRRDAPVSWQEAPDMVPHWAVVRHEDVLAVSRDPVRFSSAQGVELVPLTPGGVDLAHHMLIATDAPRHTVLRRLVSRAFTPRMVGHLEQRIRDLAVETVEQALEREECDLVHDVAARLPALVVAEVMGVPAADHDLLFDWANRIFGVQDPDFGNTPESFVAAATEIFVYAGELAADRRARPRNDVVSMLLQPDAEGQILSDLDFNCFFLLLNVAGVETTQTLIAQGTLTLLEHEDQRALLRADPALLPGAVEELLRFCCPVHHFARTTTTDVVLAGIDIPAGERVAMWYASANRDDTTFTAPHAFDVRRVRNEHVSFGAGGPHFCLGANLARLEVRIMLEELLRRVPDLELIAAPRRLRSNTVNALRCMPVRLPRTASHVRARD